ncbi:MAG: acetate uptake transporter [Methanomassiliicoccus sp.]|nr:acetate uptake transporter [Methanomassiliicoccus sp.]
MVENVVETNVRLVDTTASPDALGSMLLGWVTVLLALTAFNVVPMGGMVLLTVFFSGFGFLFVSFIGYRRGEMFTLFAFGAIAVFVWAFSSFSLLPGTGIIPAPTASEVAAFLMVFASFVGVLGFITLKMPCRLLSITIFSASLLFFMVGLHAVLGGDTLQLVWGIWGMFVGVLALYTGCAITLNTVYGKMALPLMMCEVKK